MFLMDSSPVTRKNCVQCTQTCNTIEGRVTFFLGTSSSVQNTVGVQRFRKYSSINLHDVVGKDERSIRNDGIRNPETN